MTAATGIEQIDTTEWTQSPLQIEMRAVLHTDPGVVFRAMSDPQLMCEIFDWMSRVEIVGHRGMEGITPGTRRVCVMANGLLLEEEILAWWPPFGYAYRGIEETHPFGMRGHVCTLSFMPDGDGCRVRWRQYFEHSNVEEMSRRLVLSMTAAVEDLTRRFGGALLSEGVN